MSVPQISGNEAQAGSPDLSNQFNVSNISAQNLFRLHEQLGGLFEDVQALSCTLREAGQQARGEVQDPVRRDELGEVGIHQLNALKQLLRVQTVADDFKAVEADPRSNFNSLSADERSQLMQVAAHIQRFAGAYPLSDAPAQ